jgi:hypothetical protein
MHEKKNPHLFPSIDLPLRRHQIKVWKKQVFYPRVGIFEKRYKN